MANCRECIDAVVLHIKGKIDLLRNLICPPPCYAAHWSTVGQKSAFCQNFRAWASPWVQSSLHWVHHERRLLGGWYAAWWKCLQYAIHFEAFQALLYDIGTVAGKWNRRPCVRNIRQITTWIARQRRKNSKIMVIGVNCIDRLIGLTISKRKRKTNKASKVSLDWTWNSWTLTHVKPSSNAIPLHNGST